MRFSRFLASTTLSLATALSFSVAAKASDLPAPASIDPTSPAAYRLPAVDGFNFKLDAFGGSVDDGGLGGLGGAFSFPLTERYGAQIDVTLANVDGDAYGSVAGHVFWRDPSVALLGGYASYAAYEGFGGVSAYQAALESEYYMGNITLRGVAGVEGINADPWSSGGSTYDFSDETRFFDKVDIVWYPTDDFKVSLGHRYTGGFHAAALGTEYMWHLNGGTAVSLFAEGRLGEDDYKALWAGVRVYHGQSDKTLIRRHREDDPNQWDPDTGTSIRAFFASVTPCVEGDWKKSIPGHCPGYEDPVDWEE